MNATCETLEWRKTAMNRSVYCLESDLARENDKEARAVALIRSAPSYNALLKAYHRFRRDLNKYDYNPEYILGKPWELLTAHSSVMNAKSARCLTLRKLAHAVFHETGLPRGAIGTFRGSDGLDWTKL